MKNLFITLLPFILQTEAGCRFRSFYYGLQQRIPADLSPFFVMRDFK